MIIIGTQTIGGSSSGGSSSGPTLIPLSVGDVTFNAATSPAATPRASGGSPIAVDPAVYTGSAWKFKVTGSVVSGRTATVVLYDITADAAAATLTISAQTQTAYSADVTKPDSARVYELRRGVSGSTEADYANLHNACLQIGS